MTDPERKFLLVRHSVPEMVTGVTASQWHLSAEGRRRCEVLAGRLVEYRPTFVVTSHEPKAIETGQIVAQALGLPRETETGLHEHERGVIRNLDSRDSFQVRVARFFSNPGQLVFGGETADQAHARFTAAMARVLEKYSAGTLAIVSHGTVMTLFLARANQLAEFPFWKSLTLPAFAVVALPGLELLHVVRDIAQDSIS